MNSFKLLICYLSLVTKNKSLNHFNKHEKNKHEKKTNMKKSNMKTTNMKKNNFILMISFLMILALSFSCNERENECISSNTEYVTSINSPTTGMVNETINIEVNFDVSGSTCYQSAEFIETSTGNSRSIEIEAKYEGCACSLDISPQMITYQFTASNVGSYELKFKSSPTEFITANLTIN